MSQTHKCVESIYETPTAGIRALLSPCSKDAECATNGSTLARENAIGEFVLSSAEIPIW